MDLETTSDITTQSYYQRHRKKLLLYQKNWKKQNREKVLIAKKRYRERHKERLAPQAQARSRQHYRSLTPEQKQAMREYNRLYYLANKERINRGGWQKRRPLYIQRKYGLPEKEYSTLLKKQKGVCAICNAKSTIYTGRESLLAVDHCHKTGKIRGLLCSRCNLALSFFDDDPTVLARARRYLLKHTKEDTHA